MHSTGCGGPVSLQQGLLVGRALNRKTLAKNEKQCGRQQIKRLSERSKNDGC